jgi:phospholipase C
MSVCGVVIRQISWLERQAQILATQVCTVEALEQCADWEDQGYNQCVATRDEGYSRCDQTRDEGYNRCCDWRPCSWFCDALVWVSHIVCVAWTWVSHIVCVAWQWVSKWICRVVHWIYRTVCKLVISVVFWFIKRTLLLIFSIPCGLHTPELDDRIKHIFVLMLENRSFDHMLGATPIRGRDAETVGGTQTVRRPEGTANDVVDADGNVTHHCVVGVGQRRSVGNDPGHEFGHTLVALCGFQASATYPPYPPVDNSGFAQNFAADPAVADPCTVMLSYRGDPGEEATADVPVITALAREFAVCDHWFSSMPGPTWPNRLFAHAASAAGLDDSPATGDVLIDEILAGIIFDNGTLFDLLDSENIDWAVYHGDPFPQVMALSGMDLGTIATHFHGMDAFEGHLAAGTVANYVFIEPDYGDVTGGTYACGNSQHPKDDVTHGERLIKRVYEAIRNSPVWPQSMLIVTYDEGGGFFDHVPPGPTVAPGDSITDPVDNHNGFDFMQLGVRVPAVVCSPWIPRNVIDHREYEHASIPKTVETLWDLPAMTQRDAHARGLAALLTLAASREDAPLELPDAAQPEVECPDDPRRDIRRAAPARLREAGATLLGPVTQALAQQENQAAITSTAAAFLQVALRRDLMTAPREERAAIVRQARRLQTMGEVRAYVGRVEAVAVREER